MITILYHEADAVIFEATQVLREFSSQGLVNDLALVPIGDGASLDNPLAKCMRSGDETQDGLFDALAQNQTTESHVMTAVASTALEPQAQLALAQALDRIADRAMDLAGVPVVSSCLAVPESREGDSILPAEGFFSARTANFVALPTDWQFVTGMAAAIDFDDLSRASWHAALEIATLTSAWRATTDSPWRPEIGSTGVAGYAFRFIRSAARLVMIRRREPTTEDFIPVPDGFSPTPVPEMITRTAETLHPQVFRLDNQVAGPGASSERSGVMKLLGAAVGRVFPPLAAGFQGFGKMLKTEFAKALGGEVEPDESEQTPTAPLSTDSADDAAVVLKGFDPRVWINLVRNVLGVADGGGGADAIRARDAAGHQQYVFVSPESLIDDVLEERVRRFSGQREDIEAATNDIAVAEEDINTADEVDDETTLGTSQSDLASSDTDTADEEDNETASESTTEADADPTPQTAIAGDADLAKTASRPRALLTLLDDKFRNEISRAENRRREQQAELESLTELVESTEEFDPPTALRNTFMAFFVIAFAVIASYVLLLDTFDIGTLDTIVRTRLAILATSFTWLVLLYPLIPQRYDPRAGQSYYLKSAAIVAVVAALAIIFAKPLSDLSTDAPGPELVPLVAIVGTLWLIWRVISSATAQGRPASRALALVWTICFIIAGILLYSHLDQSIFVRWELMENFFEEYGRDLRYAAVTVAGFLFLLALVMMTVSDGGNERRRRRARSRILELQSELKRIELLPILQGLRINWLGTAAALHHVLERNVPAGSASGRASRELRSPLHRLAVRYRAKYRPPPEPGWLYAQYEAAVEANAQRLARAGSRDSSRPETSTMVSSMERDLLAAPGPDLRWQFASRLHSGEFDDVLGGDSGSGSLEDAEVTFLNEVSPVASATLPVGLLGSVAANLGRVSLDSIWWLSDGAEAPDSVPPPRPAEVIRSADEDSYFAVRLEISDPILENQIGRSSTPSSDYDDDLATADNDPDYVDPAAGLG